MHTVSPREPCNSFSEIGAAHSSAADSPLRLRIVRGPLSPQDNETILFEYNKRIEPPEIPIREFLHWVQHSPEGPAWHGILESYSHGIVGHQCFIPLRATYQGRRVVAAKSEYTFLHEDFRTAKIRGFEGIGLPTHTIAAGQLALRCQAEGWGPLLISTIPSLRRRGFYGFISRNFPSWECLLVLRPLVAARETPNLPGWQRACLFAGGTVQKAVWLPASFLVFPNGCPQSALIDTSPRPEVSGFLSFFEDSESLRWRYLPSDYERLALKGSDVGYITYKRGSANQYMRICQWLLDAEINPRHIAELIRAAQRDRAMGVRWAIYGSDDRTQALVRRLRRFGFLCVPRVRTLLIKSGEVELLNPENWNLTDAMFSFHW